MWRESREGVYLLRTNLQAEAAEGLWSKYMQLTGGEASFRALKSELSIRRLFRQLERRVKARVMVAFLGYGKTSQVLERFWATVESGELRDPKFSRAWKSATKKQREGSRCSNWTAHVDAELLVLHDADLEYHSRGLLKMVEVFFLEGADVFSARLSWLWATNAHFSFDIHLGMNC